MMNPMKYLILTLTFYFLVQETDAINSYCQHTYSIVVDGGSSGTRLNVFQFDNNPNDPKIIQTFIFKSKIALSTFSNFREDWSLMRIMIKSLVDKALLVIPDHCVNETPFYLQVTAGIRQIEQRIGSRILNHLKGIISKNRFHFRNNFVDILSTSEEGKLAWISINFMLGNLREADTGTRETVGILDLGGGSTQIAFATDNTDLIANSTKISVLGQDYHIYSRGYDFMGINEARMKYFNAQQCCQLQCKDRIYRSQCVNPDVKTEYIIGNRTLNIAGKIARGSARFCHCFAKGLQFTRSVTAIRQFFGTKTFVAFSAYYFILKSAGGIFRTNEGGLNVANIRDIIIRAMEICGNPDVKLAENRFSHFLCIDLSYMVALLHNGFGFEWYDEVISAIKIRGISLSWALGYAISKF